MTKEGYTTLVVHDCTHAKLQVFAKSKNISMNVAILRMLEEKEKTITFANNITKTPESVRMYIG